MGKYQQYTECEDSGVEWLEKIPKHWSVKKLKYVSSIQPSNVDKKTKEDELPVQLCNYTDVYYNESISASLHFMKATATDEQIKKFTLIAGDTIITKDSEDPGDIAVPAYVPEDLPGIVCGYHLAMIRPKDPDMGWYIKRAFETDYARSYFSTHANGLTRYGLGTYPLSNVFFPIPPKEEAQNIAAFLDHETAKIDGLIARQERLIELLKEKRQAVISHAVTKGLNPDAPIKDSGVEWLGEVPAHWIVAQLKQFSTRVVVGIAEAATHAYVDEGIPILRATNVRTGKLIGNLLYLEASYAAERSSKCIRGGDLVTVRTGNAGVTAIVPDELDGCHCFTMLITTLKKTHSNKFFEYLINSPIAQSYFSVEGWGTAQVNISVPILQNLPVAVPDLKEQESIVMEIDRKVTRFDELVTKAQRAVELLQEHRAALISAAVTGTIDVRGWQKPDTEPEEIATAVSA